MIGAAECNAGELDVFSCRRLSQTRLTAIERARTGTNGGHGKLQKKERGKFEIRNPKFDAIFSNFVLGISCFVTSPVSSSSPPWTMARCRLFALASGTR